MNNQSTFAIIKITTTDMFSKVIETILKFEYIRDHYSHDTSIIYIKDDGSGYKTYFVSPDRIPDGIEPIDCGTNANYFFAIAAMNCENDHMKLFRYKLPNGNKLFFQFLGNGKIMDDDDEIIKYDGPATLEEIINFFSNQ